MPDLRRRVWGRLVEVGRSRVRESGYTIQTFVYMAGGGKPARLLFVHMFAIYCGRR